MKKSILTFVTFLFLLSAFAQEKTYTSTYTNKAVTTFETVDIDRVVIISDKQIKISKYLNGSVDELVLKINKIEEKEFSWEGICKWYYCERENISDSSSKYIIIHINTAVKSELNVYTFKDEVFVYHQAIILNKR